jgi:hypothetical protein
MKKWMFTMMIGAASLLTACSKEGTITENGDQAAQSRAVANGQEEVFASRWEAATGWSQQDSANFKVFRLEKSLPQFGNTAGALLVWARNYRDADGQPSSRPRQLPFSVYPQPGRPAWHEAYYFQPLQAAVRISYRTNRAQYEPVTITAPTGLELRYFVIEAEALNKIGHTAATIRELSYEELTRLLNTGE